MDETTKTKETLTIMVPVEISYSSPEGRQNVVEQILQGIAGSTKVIGISLECGAFSASPGIPVLTPIGLSPCSVDLETMTITTDGDAFDDDARIFVSEKDSPD